MKSHRLLLPLLLMAASQTAHAQERSLQLDALDVSRFSVGFGLAQRARSSEGKPLSIGGQKFAGGIGVHARSVAQLDLHGSARRFRARVGVDDEVAGQKASVEFIVSGDGKTLWKSGVMRAGQAAKAIDVDVRNVKMLQLEVSDGGDGVDYDHADWAEASLTYEGDAPQMARDPKQIWIEAGSLALVLAVGQDKRLYQLHFGASNTGFAAGDSLNSEAYLPFGERSILEPALQVAHADGNTSTGLEFVSQSVQKLGPDVTQTRIELKDPNYPFLVSLLFKAYAGQSVIEQWSEIRHQENAPVMLYQFASAAPTFGTGDYYLTQFRGSWANEMNREEEKLGYGQKVLASRLGARAHEFLASSFLISSGAPSQEDAGEVFGASFAYSGSFQFQFEVASDHRLRAVCGMNPQASQYRLQPNQVFATPPMIWSYSASGRGELSRQFARWGRQYGMRQGNEPRDILLNNWEATYFSFDEKKLVSLFDGARELGMEMFLLDDGWFANKYPRDSDRQGLGDWQPMAKKLPSGLSYLAEEAKKRGLRFGLWLEPEMVNPRSELFEAHPDWAIRQPGRELNLSRNQLVLDLANPKVGEWMFNTVDGILSANPGITYVKWDCNRFITQPGSKYLAADEQSHLWIEYYRSFYDVMQRLVKKHPDVEIMVCSGGGGRVDYSSLRLAHEFWPSDNTDPLHRIRIQWGYEQFFPTSAIAAHVTDMGRRPLKFAFDVAMSARLGMDMDTSKLSAEEKAFAKSAIATYKSIRDVVQLGDVFRLESPYEGARASQLSVSPDRSRAVVFAWQMRDGAASRLALQGLDASKRYSVREINLKAGQAAQIAESGRVLDGASLMKSGLGFSLSKAFESSVVELRAQA